ncbi:MAG: response regulator transcription factor [Nitrospira sp.]|nr:response regulator transcription factor [Nitrospira sp.]
MYRPTVIIADDHAMVRAALRKLLEQSCEVVQDVGDGLALVEASIRLKPDIILIDIAMPLLNGLEAGRELKRRVPNAKLIFLTATQDPDVAREAFRLGASGYLSKNSAASELPQAIHYVLCGKSYLTPLISQNREELFRGEARKDDSCDHLTSRQKEILQLFAEGFTMKEVAGLLHITPRTVAFHKYRLMEEFGLKSNASLIQFAMKRILFFASNPL